MFSTPAAIKNGEPSQTFENALCEASGIYTVCENALAKKQEFVPFVLKKVELNNGNSFWKPSRPEADVLKELRGFVEKLRAEDPLAAAGF